MPRTKPPLRTGESSPEQDVLIDQKACVHCKESNIHRRHIYVAELTESEISSSENLSDATVRENVNWANYRGAHDKLDTFMFLCIDLLPP